MQWRDIASAPLPREVIDEAYLRWPDPHNQTQGNCRFGFLLGYQYAKALAAIKPPMDAPIAEGERK